MQWSKPSRRVRLSRNHVVLATGRNIMATMPVAKTLGLRRGWAVTSNGAVTIRLNPAMPGGYEIVRTVTFNPRAALELIRDEMPDAFFAVEDPGRGIPCHQALPDGRTRGEPGRLSTLSRCAARRSRAS